MAQKLQEIERKNLELQTSKQKEANELMRMKMELEKQRKQMELMQTKHANEVKARDQKRRQSAAPPPKSNRKDLASNLKPVYVYGEDASNFTLPTLEPTPCNGGAI